MDGIREFNLEFFKQLFRNSVRFTTLVWRERKWQMIILGIVFFVVSLTPFLRSGSQGLLINDLINVAGTGV